MHIRNYILAVFSATAALISCNNSESPETLTNVDNQTCIKADSIELTTLGANQTHINADSVELTALVRNVYEWHEIKYHNHSFPLKFNRVQPKLSLTRSNLCYDNSTYHRHEQG